MCGTSLYNMSTAINRSVVSPRGRPVQQVAAAQQSPAKMLLRSLVTLPQCLQLINDGKPRGNMLTDWPEGIIQVTKQGSAEHAESVGRERHVI